jgi:hypothetical protein
MDCNFKQQRPIKRQTKAQQLDNILDILNEDLFLRKGTIHAYHAYGGVLLVTGTNDVLYGVDRTTDGKMIDVVQQIISVLEFARKTNHGRKSGYID